MKKQTFFMAAWFFALMLGLVFTLSACASQSGGGAATAVSPSTQAAGQAAIASYVGMTLDEAIAKVAEQMDARLPARTEVALVSVSSPSSSLAFSQYVLDRLEAALVGSGKLVVVDRTNLDKVREEQGFQLTGEVSDATAKSIGKMVGAGAIVTGSLTNIGTLYGITIKAIDVEKAVVAVSFTADIANDERVGALLAQSSIAAVPRSTVSQNSTAQSSTAQTPAPSAEADTSGTTAATAVSPGATNPEPVKPTAITTLPPVPAPVPSVYNVGDRGPAGGIVFYDKGVVTYGWRYLEAAPKDLPAPIRWGPNNAAVNNTDTAVGSGKANTQRIAPIINRYGEDGAALFCIALNINGHQDWFLPSKDELNLMYVNLKKKGLGDFGDGYYWSSSEYNYFDAWVQRFSDGSQNYSYYYTSGDKGYARSVRAIRAF
ncbi:hypothetical protein FACS1894200_06750 [Spirochaetia bacterium]|nr:hypothetical protein FACS1894200_06750 [Spirochaetia bacterium]